MRVPVATGVTTVDRASCHSNAAGFLVYQLALRRGFLREFRSSVTDAGSKMHRDALAIYCHTDIICKVIKKSLCTWRLQYNHQVHTDFLITLYFPFLIICRVKKEYTFYENKPQFHTFRTVLVCCRDADKSLARPDWKSHWKVAIIRPTRRSLLPRRPGWTENLLSFLMACKS